MKYFIIFILILTTSNVVLSQTIEFSSQNDRITTFEGDTIIVSVDTAYIIHKDRAKWLNYQLQELDTIKSLYSRVYVDHRDLIKETIVVQKQLTRLIDNMNQGGINVSQDFDDIIFNLEKIIDDLRNNNEKQELTISDLNKNVVNLEKIVKDLKIETRKIWWNGTTDKLVALAGGIVIGFLISITI